MKTSEKIIKIDVSLKNPLLSILKTGLDRENGRVEHYNIITFALHFTTEVANSSNDKYQTK